MYPAIVPCLLVADGVATLDFLRRTFGAEEKMRVPGEGGRGVMHAEITVDPVRPSLVASRALAEVSLDARVRALVLGAAPIRAPPPSGAPR